MRRRTRREVRLKPLLPLFPLDVVLFPGTPLPLHIFEPRYKELISECLQRKTVFGLIKTEENGLADIGCTAEIVAVTKKYDDGRMDIVTEGRERFELLEINEERAFLRGDVVYFDDDPGRASETQIAHVVKLHSEIMAMAGATQDLPENYEHLSFYLVGSLPLDLEFKQTLLEMRSEPARIDAVITAFETILPKLRRTVQVRQKAGGNGHAH
jgi:Lon protease-like protein